ncbi:MAG TPA: outer membrane beta-barrel protein [Caulobacteraceae bacterium]|jgi:hypothetical protein|nr:outer membrane beta-barrel protein [Caulobacteraceae bacterium]
MTKLKLIMCAGATTLGIAWAGAAAAQSAAPAAAPAAPTPSPMANPPITAPMAANPYPEVVDAGPLGKITVDGVLSGLVGWQSPSPTFAGGPDRTAGFGDLSNAQIMINKSDGVFQFYVQAGDYSLPALGATYFKAGVEPPQTFGYVPEGFIKIVPNSTWSIEAGALPTLIGDEYNFTFQNMNIERGLLWGQEPAISKGVQVNFTQGPIAVSVAYTDGYYSNTYSAISGLATYTFKNSDTLAFAGAGNVTTNRVNTFATPPAQNNGEIFNLIYSHSAGPWSISPYIQYQSNPRVRGAFGNPPLALAASAWAGAVLTKYNFTPEISLAGRVEYISSSGQQNILGFGAGSNAWSITVTPTYQKGVFFARAEASYVSIGSGTLGDGFGEFGTKSSQVRLMAETGIDF